MVIRKALEKDAESIVDININGWQETYYGIFPNEFLKSLSSIKEENIKKCKSKISEYIVCEIDNNIVGFLKYGKNKKNYDNKYAEVYAIYIISEYKRKGVGRKLLDYSFELLKDNYNNVLISTLKTNPANEFYKKCGGIKIGTCSFKVANNEYEENLYLFKLM